MTRLLILLAIVVGVAWWLLKRRPASGSDAGQAVDKPAAEPAKMVACAHCGVHLPRPEASCDADGRAFCSEAHRLAGPR
jgi:uncharacterized protein